MQILWNGEDITKTIGVSDVLMHDRAGGMADNVDIIIPDPEQSWAMWKPVKGDIVEVVEGDFTTGAMYFDGWEIVGQSYKAMGMSTPPAGRSGVYKSWNKPTLLEIANEKTVAAGLDLVTYDITDYPYNRVDQLNQGHIHFLNMLCEREGYALKITNGKAVIFGEKAFEQKPAVKTIYQSQMIGEYKFKSLAADLKSSCVMKFYNEENNLIDYTYTASGIYGSQLRLNDHVASQGEAERFTKAALRMANKYESKGYFTIRLDTTLAAAVNIDIQGIGAADGKWYLYHVCHSLLNGITYCWCRRPIEGDY